VPENDSRSLPAVPGAIIGYRKDGRPIRLLAGGADENGKRITLDSPVGDQIRNIAHHGHAGRPYLRQLAAKADQDKAAADRVPQLERRVGDLERRGSVTVEYEPPVYGPTSQFSWFRDMAAAHIPMAHIDRDGGKAGAEQRLHRYAAYEHHQTERRLIEARNRAESLTETAVTSTRQEAILYERWQRAGGKVFEQMHELDGQELGMERRALNRTTGSGGTFSPPAWLVDRFVHAPREGAPFSALWTQLPMPPGVSSVNLPRFASGSGSGAMIDGASVPNRDPADGTVKGNLITIAAQVDVSLQWLDQTPIPPDASLGADIAEDFLIQLDGQLLLGAGSGGQAQGVISAGTFSASNLIWLQNTANASGMSWSNGAGASAAIAGSMHTSAAQLRSKIRRYRGLAPTHWVVPPTVMDIISGSGVDAQDRPLVLPGMGGADDVPMLHWTQVVEDANIPLTFGGTTAPSIGVSSGVTSPTDGSGSWAPMLLGRWSDCIFWQSEPVVRVMSDVLGGTLQARFQVHTYIAAIPNRVQWAGGNVSFSGSSQGGGVNTGAAVSYGGLTQFTSNGILQSGLGY
jgi:HK97 family phage major capsid protein